MQHLPKGKQKVKVSVSQSHLTLCDSINCGCQALLSMGFSSVQWEWLPALGKNTGVSSQPFPSPGNFADTGIKPRSPTLQAGSYSLSYQGSQKEHKP